MSRSILSHSADMPWSQSLVVSEVSLYRSYQIDQTSQMKSTSVTDLKARLSHYLRLAQRGSEVQILDRGVPIARLVGIRGSRVEEDKSRLQRLSQAGLLRCGSGDLSWLLTQEPMPVDCKDLSLALAEDREDRV
jgi:prevent-host-death family protein